MSSSPNPLLAYAQSLPGTLKSEQPEIFDGGGGFGGISFGGGGGGFLPVGSSPGGGTTIGGGGFPGLGPITIGYNPPGAGGGGITVGGGGQTTTIQNAPSSSCGYNPLCYLQNLFTSTGDLLLRLVFLILGLMCVAGAIYLFKPTSVFVTAPVNAVKRGAKAAGAAAFAA